MGRMNEPNPPRFTPHGLVPTKEQTAIQLSQSKVVLIDANAGAAKTTTLALRIGEAIARKMAPEQILALTFTPEARDVMRQRLLDIGVPFALVNRIAVLTFEDFAALQLERIDGDEVRPCPEARQLKDYVLAAIDRVQDRYAGRFDGLDLRTHGIALSQFLDVQLTLKATMALEADVEFIGEEEAAETMGVPLTDYLITREYETLRLDGGAGAQFRGPLDATYDLACNLAGPAQLAQYLPDYRMVLCDELHDLNEAAFRILNALIERPKCYFVGAGDKDQVIHARLGASDQYLNRRFKDSYPQLVRYPLTFSYRHGPHLAYAMAEFKAKPVDSSLPVHTEIRQAHYDNADAGAALAVAAVQQWRRDGFALDGCAILIRERHQSIAIENALRQADIDYRTPPMAGYLQRGEILFLRGMLAIALKDFAAVKSAEVRGAVVDAVATFSELGLPPERMDKLRGIIVKSPEMLGELFFVADDGRRGEDERQAEYGGYRAAERLAAKRAVIDTIAWLGTLDADAPAEAVLREVCERTRLAATARRVFVRPYDAAVVEKSVAGLLAMAAASGLNLREFWRTLNEGEAFLTRKRARDAVLIECVANAKGKEFDHVVLPYLESGEFPAPMSEKLAEENLFYVGATRARHRLTLLSPSDAERRSVFVAQMKLAKTAAPAQAAVERNEQQHKQLRQLKQQPAAQAAARHYLTATFHEKDQVKALGAEYDLARRAWFVPPGKDLAPFAQWLRPSS
jgi:DNA helicase-2/ATP-dependent DNA helicase PcrA